ncbi:MAG: hypothetical protein ABI165_21170 [Bryobacteraceae bacterium]
MQFDPKAYGAEVAGILSLDGGGARLMPLAGPACSSEPARGRLAAADPSTLFPGASAPEAALSGLWLYYSCLEECHELAQQISSHEGSYWHAILHRREPDPGNAAYWFRRVGTHPVFEPLREAAREILKRFPGADFRPPARWDPFAFITFCEQARRQERSAAIQAAMEIQLAEWQLLFDCCARTRKS